MGEKRVGTWGEFEAKAWAKIEGMASAVEAGWQPFTDRVLFRGQADAGWELTTTLQRATGKSEEAVDNYQMQMHAVRDSVASVQGQDWDTEGVLPLPGFVVKGIEFMVYLRQNGFPSPLLDWTASPYIAACFAFRDVQRGAKRAEHVAIYTYEELSEEDERVAMSFRSREAGSVYTIGPCLMTDRKHHLQQCQYTLCVRGEGDEFHYAAYPDDVGTCDTRRCVIEKYVIPLSEQEAVLRRLQMMNVTAYSLFGTEAALMESLAIREVFLKGR
jgi:hypothetical protein